MENEENGGLIHKKASEDQLVTFCQFNFGALSLFSISLTLGHLEFLGVILEGKRKQRSSRERQDQAATTGFIIGINLHVYFPLLDLDAWHCNGFFFIMEWVSPGVTMFLA